MENRYTKWVACWGNATSISDRREAVYAKDITLRYPVRMCFDGCALRLHLSNLTGTEKVTVSKAFAGNVPFTFGGCGSGVIEPGREIVSDEVKMEIKAGDSVDISLYFADYTQLNAGTLVTGPLSYGFYSYGDHCLEKELPRDLSRKTNWFYFLNTIDVLTEEKNFAVICYGDSITAQSWPDYLAIRSWEQGFRDVAIIRRAVCGTRVLRQYDCISYQAYGLKGSTRFPNEIDVAGARTVIIQHGINDIIHPVGEDVNPFRPWSDLPAVEELQQGVEEIYVSHARKCGLQVWGGTLLPIKGWRTYNEMREEMRQSFNSWMRRSPVFDGVIDFDSAVRDPLYPLSFAPGFDSGDHLHPSEDAYKAMAYAVPSSILSGKQIRHTIKEDIPEIMEIFRQAKEKMRSDGNMTQWAGAYPSEQSIIADIEASNSYVVTVGGRIEGTFAFIPGIEPTYAHIEGGEWENDNAPYATVHRIASAHGSKGVARACFDYALEHSSSVRVDTHEDNNIMRHCIEKAGFVYRGIIYVADGTPRLAYQLFKNK